MTRKSAARMKRDQVAKELGKLRNDKKCKQAWDDLKEHHTFACAQIVKFSVIGKQLLNNKHLVDYLTNPQETNDSIVTLSKDLKKFKAMFDDIHSKHSGRTGRPVDNDDMIKVIDFTQQYTELLESMAAIVEPVSKAIIDDFQVAQDRHAIATGEEPRAVAQAMASGNTVTFDSESGDLKVVPYANQDGEGIAEISLVDKATASEIENTQSESPASETIAVESNNQE